MFWLEFHLKKTYDLNLFLGSDARVNGWNVGSLVSFISEIVQLSQIAGEFHFQTNQIIFHLNS